MVTGDLEPMGMKTFPDFFQPLQLKGFLKIGEGHVPAENEIKRWAGVS